MYPDSPNWVRFWLGSVCMVWTMIGLLLLFGWSLDALDRLLTRLL